MATTTLTITDGPGGVLLVVESDPPLPLPEGEPDIEAMTPGQALTIGVLMNLSDQMGGFDWRTLLR
jgi:hypothetical protein